MEFIESLIIVPEKSKERKKTNIIDSCIDVNRNQWLYQVIKL